MTKISNKVCGIDLGTTNSCIAIIEGGRVKIIENENGENTTPSVVLFNEKGEKEAVGETAKIKAALEPERVVFEAKRLMGRKFNPTEEKEKTEIEKFRAIAPFKIVPSKKGDAWVEVEGKKYSPEQISAFILQEMKRIAEDYLGETVKKVVITVPAYFEDAQREATKSAGKIAGLEVLRVINEPTAAALAYGVDKNKNQTVAVFDLGGGTFDISIIEINQGVFEVKATNGDGFLGGANFDEEIINWLAKEFKKEYGIDLRTIEDKTPLQKLKEEAEKAKKRLSKLPSVDINQPFIYTDASGPKHIKVKLSQQKLKELTADLLKRLTLPCEECIKDVKKKDNKFTKESIDEVILVGGMTRMLAVREKVKEIFGKEPNKSVNPDEAVAAGAAVQGAVLSGENKEGIVLLDVTPLSLGIETLGGVFTRLIKRNTTIPTGKKEIFSTAVDNQPMVTIGIFQGEREFAKDNKSLKIIQLTGIEPAPKGVPQIEVAFDINSDGLLEVTARDITNPNKIKEVKETVENIQGGLSKEEVEEAIREAEASAEKDQKKRENIEKLNQLRDHLYNFEKQIKNFEKLKNEPQFQELQKLYENLKEAVDKGDKEDFSQIEPALEKIAEMNKIAEELKQKMPKEDENKDKEDKNKK